MDMGPLKRVKFDTPGHAEVTYVDRKDAEKAVERYVSRIMINQI